MSTAAQIAANRRNAEKSTGPKTPEGKVVVSQNAVQHGLLSRRAVLKDEDPAQFDLHRTRLLEAFAPAGPEEELTAERVVVLWWRLKRAERMQDEMLDYLMEADGTDSWTRQLRERGDPSAAEDLTFGRVIARDFAKEGTLDRLMMYEQRIESTLYKTRSELRRLQAEREHRHPVVETQDVASPQGIAVNSPCCAKQSQSLTEGGSDPCREACAVAGGTFVETQHLASLQEGVAANGPCCAKQSQSPAEDGGYSLPCGTGSAAEPACKTKPIPMAVPAVMPKKI
jgi:hypothetical protein